MVIHLFMISAIFKCFIEQCLIILFLTIIGLIISSIIPNVICKTLSFFLSGHYYKVYNVIKGICQIIWLIISLISLVHIFKLRYLNYYDKIIKDEAKVGEKPVELKKENQKREEVKEEKEEAKDESPCYSEKYGQSSFESAEYGQSDSS